MSVLKIIYPQTILLSSILFWVGATLLLPVIIWVGDCGLAKFGYLSIVSQYMYNDLGATSANIIVGFLSAIINHIPVMYAVLTMDPVMSHGQWLLVTLTVGVGGSALHSFSSWRGPNGHCTRYIHL